MSKKKIAIVFGAAGQDGTLMTFLLLKKNYKVYALSQTSSFSNLRNIKKKNNLIKKKINYYNYKQVKALIIKSKCREIYFFGGHSSPFFSFKNYLKTFKSNFLPVYNILQSIFIINKNIILFNSSSSEIFKSSSKSINENSVKEPNNPYGLAKLNTFLLVKYFRENYKLKCFSGILFNHESRFRNKNYVIPKIFHYINKKKFSKKLQMGNLNVTKDFGWAEEYVDIIFQIINKKIYDDFIIATGRSYKIKKVLSMIFQSYKMNWKKFVIILRKLKRNNETKNISANINKLKKFIKVRPKIFLPEIILKLKREL
jgi:GDPmannose 4,6-dehydratase